MHIVNSCKKKAFFFPCVDVIEKAFLFLKQLHALDGCMMLYTHEYYLFTVHVGSSVSIASPPWILQLGSVVICNIATFCLQHVLNGGEMSSHFSLADVGNVLYNSAVPYHGRHLSQS